MWKCINIYWVTPRVFSWGTRKHQQCPVNNDTPVHGRNLSIPVDFVAGHSLCGSTRHSGAIFSSLPSQCSTKERHSCSLRKKTVLQWTPYTNVKGNDGVDNQAIFYFMSVHIEVILDQKTKQQKQYLIIIYTKFPTGLWTIDLTILVIISVLYKISLILL